MSALGLMINNFPIKRGIGAGACQLALMEVARSQFFIGEVKLTAGQNRYCLQ